jgi:ribosomal protein S18 acetylase RimI-like enzyme
MTPEITISALSADGIAGHSQDLAVLLHACVHAGASVGFVLPHDIGESEAYWQDKVLPAARGGKLVMLVAWCAGRIAGTVQLDHDTMPNQPHRAEVRKLLVHPDFRRRGIARRLMMEIEAVARQKQRTLLTLDTRSGDSAEPLYAALGFETAGIIPGYCLDPFSPRLDATTVMYKRL